LVGWLVGNRTGEINQKQQTGDKNAKMEQTKDEGSLYDPSSAHSETEEGVAERKKEGERM